MTADTWFGLGLILWLVAFIVWLFIGAHAAPYVDADERESLLAHPCALRGHSYRAVWQCPGCGDERVASFLYDQERVPPLTDSVCDV